MKPWPLAVSQFNFLDRLKIGWWIVRHHQWTQGPEVRKYEETWARYTGARHAVMVANGSLANELIARRRKTQLVEAGQWPERNKVVFPVCTWVSSVSPWLHYGFEPVWVDADPMAYDRDIYDALSTDRAIGTVFYTTLLGMCGDLEGVASFCRTANTELMLDNCEGSFSSTSSGYSPRHHRKHVCTIGISSTSFYFSHPATTGTEGGMIFCDKDEDNEWFRMMRNHGLTRGMPGKYHNPDADKSFDFYLAGTNARASEIEAFMGSLTFERSLRFSAERVRMAEYFYSRLDYSRFELLQAYRHNPLMGLPLIPNPTMRGHDPDFHRRVLADFGIETRPIIGGNLLRHTAFKQYGNAGHYPRSQWIHGHGVYIGLHEGVSYDMLEELTDALLK
jgi:CDP-4-dehydro-6-deoxyglucose reductase, E1